MIDMVLMKRDLLQYVQDMRALKGMGEVSQITMLYYVKSG